MNAGPSRNRTFIQPGERKAMEDDILKNEFTYHATEGNQVERYNMIRQSGLVLATVINNNCLECYETDEAFKKVNEAIFWANAAIARHEKKGQV